MISESEAEKVIKKIINHVRDEGLSLFSFAEEVELCKIIKTSPLSKLFVEFSKLLIKKTSTTEEALEAQYKSIFNPKIANKPTPQPDFNDSEAMTELANDCRSVGLMYLVCLGDESLSWDRRVKTLIQLDSKATQLMAVGNRLIGYHKQTLERRLEGQNSVKKSSRIPKAEHNRRIVEDLYRRFGKSLKFRIAAQKATGRGERTVMEMVKTIERRDAVNAVLANLRKPRS